MLRPVDKRKQRQRKRKGSGITEWLNQIQQDSWQLELVISGVVVFLLLAAYQPLRELNRAARIKALSGHGLDELLNIASSVLVSATVLLTVGFLLHLILRGFWIGAVGLRSVSGDFNFDVLGYHQRYESWLRKSLGSFDHFIEKLEVRSSIAFSVAFLLFFIIVSLGMYLVVAGVTGWLFMLMIDWADGISGDGYSLIAIVPISLFFMSYLFGGLLYAIDFITMGALKKVSWFRYFYYPIYRFMGWVTLARFYRPFYYNLIDHPFGRRLVKWIIPLLLVFIFIDGLQVGRNAYFPLHDASPEFVRPQNYLTAGDQLDFTAPSLATYYPTSDYLELFIPYIGEEIEGVIQQRFPDVRPSTNEDFGFEAFYDIEETVPTDSLLMAMKGIHQLSLGDSLLNDVPWKFYHHPDRKQQGMIYGLPIYDLPRGEHCLLIKRLAVIKRDSLGWENWWTGCFLR